MRRTIRLRESDIHRIVKESMNRIIKEDLDGNLMHKDLRFVRDQWYDRGGYGAKKALQTLRDYIYHLYGDKAENPRINRNYVNSLFSKIDDLEKAINPDSDLATAAANQRLNSYSNKGGKIQPTRFRSDDEEPEDWYERNEHGDFDLY